MNTGVSGAVKLSGGERMVSLARDDAGHVLAMARPTGELWRLRDGAVSVLERFPSGTFGVIGNAADGALLVATTRDIERRRQQHLDAAHAHIVVGEDDGAWRGHQRATWRFSRRTCGSASASAWAMPSCKMVCTT